MDLTVVAYGTSIFATLLAVSTVAFLGTWEIQTNTIPPFLSDQGFTPGVFSNQVADAVTRIRRETATRTETEILVSGQVTPVGELASYFGLSNLIRASQRSLGVGPPRIEIEVTQIDETAHWRVRGTHAVRGWTVEEGEARVGQTRELIDEVAYATLGFVSPFEAVAYDLVQDSWVGDYTKTIGRSSDLIAACETPADWMNAAWRSSANWGSETTFSTAGGCTAENVRLGLIVRGLAYLNSGGIAEAFDDLHTASKQGTPSALAVAFLGDAMLALKNEDAARDMYQRAIGIDATIAERFHSFGRGVADAGNHPLALHRYRTAERLGASSAAFLADWGDSLHATGSFEEALIKYQLAESINPDTEAYADRIEKARDALAEQSSRSSEDGTAQSDDSAAETDRTPGTATE